MANPLQSFIWGRNGRALTPEQVDRERELAAAAAQRAGDTSPVGHWTAGMARVVDALGANLREKRADSAEEAGMASAKEKYGSVIDGLLGGSYGGGSAAPGMSYAAPDPNSPEGIAADTMAALGKDRASVIKAGLLQRGLPEHVADAFVMNFQDESGLNPGINEANPVVPGSRGGFGLAQWTGPRRQGLERFAVQRGSDVADLNTQLDYLMYELGGPESAAAKSIMAAPDKGAAAAAIVNDFLRPADEHRARRAASYTGGQGYTPPGMDGGVMKALMAAEADPWAAKAYGPIINALMGQQFQRQQAADDYAMKTNDPAYQMGLKKAQIELDALRNTVAPKPIEVGGVLLDPTDYHTIFDSRVPKGGGGFTLSPGEQRFDAQGKPIASVAPEAASRPMTPEERSQWGIPQEDTRPYAMTSDGPKLVGGNGVTVNNNMGGDKFAEEFAKGDAQTLVAISDTGNAAIRNLGRLDQIEGLLSTSPSGLSGALAQKAGEWGINTEGLNEIQSAQALINSMVPEQRQPGSGSMSDRDVELFKQTLPRIINQPGGNQIILNALRGIAEYDAEGAKIVQELRSGKLSRADAFAALQARENPLASFSAGGGSPQGASGETSGKIQWKVVE